MAQAVRRTEKERLFEGQNGGHFSRASRAPAAAPDALDCLSHGSTKMHQPLEGKSSQGRRIEASAWCTGGARDGSSQEVGRAFLSRSKALSFLRSRATGSNRFFFFLGARKRGSALTCPHVALIRS